MAEKFYHRCPNCGHKQKSQAKEKVKCHRCGTTYKESTHRCLPPQPKKKDGKFQPASEMEDQPK